MKYRFIYRLPHTNHKLMQNDAELDVMAEIEPGKYTTAIHISLLQVDDETLCNVRNLKLALQEIREKAKTHFDKGADQQENMHERLDCAVSIAEKYFDTTTS